MTEYQARTPRPFRLYSGGLFVLGVGAFVASWVVYPPDPSVQLILVIVGVGLSEVFAVSFPSYSFSLAYPLNMSAVVLGGPSAACLAALASAVNPEEIRRRKPPAVMAFNTGQLLLSTAVGSWAYIALGGRVLTIGPWQLQELGVSDFPQVLLAMTAAAVTCSGLNLLMTSVGSALLRAVSARQVIAQAVSFLPTQVALAFVGFLMAQVLAISAITLPLFVFPLVVARQLYQRYLGLKVAYVDTVRSLIGALEAKDPYTRGHSERVATYALAIGEQMDLDPRGLERLEYAALLHDLGKLAMSRGILTKPSKLSDEEMVVMRRHPQVGSEMVTRIPPLRELAEFVRQHHERYSGQGYPLGTFGESIPVFSRMLAVADSYDAMTTDRAYRPAMSHAQAIAELRAGASTQFDPTVVDAFIASKVSRDYSPSEQRASQLASAVAIDGA